MSLCSQNHLFQRRIILIWSPSGVCYLLEASIINTSANSGSDSLDIIMIWTLSSLVNAEMKIFINSFYTTDASSFLDTSFKCSFLYNAIVFTSAKLQWYNDIFTKEYYAVYETDIHISWN